MNTKSKAVVGIVAVLLLIAGWWILGVQGTPEGKGPIKIGASLPLTGEAASYGEMTKPGIDLAVREINDSGGIEGRPIEIVYEDDKCSSEGGSSAFNKLVAVDKVAAVIGPVCSVAASAALPIAQKSGVPTLIIASAPGLTKIGDYIFRVYPSDSLQGKFAAEYVFNTLGKHAVAILYVKNDWGEGLKDTFNRRFTELGGTVTLSEGIVQGRTDVRTELTKIKASSPQLIYIPLQPDSGVAVAKQAKALGINAPLFGGDFFDTKEFTTPSETAGILFTIGKFNNPEEFKARIKSETGADSAILTPLGYDALKVFAYVIGEAGIDPQAMQRELSDLSYTDGESQPLISFDKDGDLEAAQFEVRVVKSGKSEPFEK
ncbi:hypothetical protein A3A39_01200 [Candidatus Kaiserbacteria bacterium RIFCSPLOWO2_01_FULL_54_13]|uniref:Leucine-binding protein domain-containing protein n=1 Tax=Candidatus Kaiserbacteria bacterium RIFCSPLOWO2_01_FULL_54_13 TaxID=1798512 RepID=A0A1F6F2B5_9BACT|nr:MAG: hypothetical protein A3A39_01200 [Candidatus Kaiserbacteria bacterium RIFCSPLOWO2_01_FULL_54_13]